MTTLLAALLLAIAAGAGFVQWRSIDQYLLWTSRPRSKGTPPTSQGTPTPPWTQAALGPQQAIAIWRGRIKLMRVPEAIFPPGLVRRPNREEDIPWFIWRWTYETTPKGLESLELPIWYVSAATGPVGLGCWLIPVLRRRHRAARGRCPECGYSLDGARTAVCPECGGATQGIS